MSHTPLRSRLPRVHRRVLHALLLAFAFALLAGCTAMPSRSTGDAPPPRSQHPVIAQASALLQVGGQVDGSQIDALLSQLDNATLQAEAAALPVGDPSTTTWAAPCCAAACRSRARSTAARGSSMPATGRRRPRTATGRH